MRLDDLEEVESDNTDYKLELLLHVILDAIYVVVVVIMIMIASFCLIKDITEYNVADGPVVESIIINKD